MAIDLAIVGAGPAGMAASLVACQHGLNVLVIDDQQNPGGQILRRPPTEFSFTNWLPEPVYGQLHRLYRSYGDLKNCTHLGNSQVLGVTAHGDKFTLHVHGPAGLNHINAGRVLLASGCYDMPWPIPGAQLPGVMTAGGIQAFVKSQRIVPGRRFVFAGTHPLQLIVAKQVADAGGDVAGVFFFKPIQSFLRLLQNPAALFRQRSSIYYFFQALASLRQRRIPIGFGCGQVHIKGELSLQGVEISVGNKSRSINCDRLGLCFGFLTNNNLARQTGVHCDWSEQQGGWIVQHDQGMRTSVAGIYVAGETTGVAGANVAILEGQVAALSVSHDAGILDQKPYHQAVNKLLTPLRHANQFAKLLARLAYPGGEMTRAALKPVSQLCKCEEITLASAREILTQNPDICDLNAFKLLSRCGMGHCQGRYCHYHSRILLAFERQLSPESVGGFTARFPSMPVRVNQLLGDSTTEEVS